MSYTYSAVRTLLIATVALASGACAGQRSDMDPFRSGPGGRELPVLLTVDNQDYRDATVWANWNGRKHRLGMVIGKTPQTFEMSWRDYEMWLEVDFIGGGELKTGGRMAVWPGEHLDFIIMMGW